MALPPSPWQAFKQHTQTKDTLCTPNHHTCMADAHCSKLDGCRCCCRCQDASSRASTAATCLCCSHSTDYCTPCCVACEPAQLQHCSCSLCKLCWHDIVHNGCDAAADKAGSVTSWHTCASTPVLCPRNEACLTCRCVRSQAPEGRLGWRQSTEMRLTAAPLRW